MKKLICDTMKGVVAQAERDKQARSDSAANGTAGPVEPEAKEYYKRENRTAKIQGYAALYVIVGCISNYYVTGHLFLGIFLSPVWPHLLIKHLFGGG